jgi:hypothetical protein
MATGEEQRRAPRTLVDVEARLMLGGQTIQGFIQDLSPLGSLFVPERALQIDAGDSGSMRFAMPPAENWIEPRVEARRTTMFRRAGGEQAQSIGFQFSGLRPDQEDAVAEGCREWAIHRVRQYALAARCFVQGEGKLAAFSRFGKLIQCSRSYARMVLPTDAEFPRGSRLKLKMGSSPVATEIEQATVGPEGLEVLLRIHGWRCDFFLHEVRKDLKT